MQSDDFAGRPYGFTTNQISHAAVGFLGLTYMVTLLSYLLFGEFPHKELIVILAGVSYLGFELVSQGWNEWDTVEDWWFVNAYGVWVPVLTFTEVHPGSPALSGDLLTPVPLVLVFFAHLGFGALYRHFQSKGLL